MPSPSSHLCFLLQCCSLIPLEIFRSNMVTPEEKQGSHPSSISFLALSSAGHRDGGCVPCPHSITLQPLPSKQQNPQPISSAWSCRWQKFTAGNRLPRKEWALNYYCQLSTATQNKQKSDKSQQKSFWMPHSVLILYCLTLLVPE